MKTAIGIKQEHSAKVSTFLATILADEFVLSTKTRKAHWNVEGIDFHSKHLFFESQYNELDEIIDDVAERIRAIGHYVPATLKGFLSLTRLTEERVNNNESSGFIKDLVEDHETIIIKIREILYAREGNFLDFGTNDFTTGLMAKHEKMVWMLRASLK